MSIERVAKRTDLAMNSNSVRDREVVALASAAKSDILPGAAVFVPTQKPADGALVGGRAARYGRRRPKDAASRFCPGLPAPWRSGARPAILLGRRRI